MTSSNNYRFQKSNRLLNAAAFGRVFKKAVRSRDNLFIVLCRGRETDDVARLGMAISKKHCKKASSRNRIKRMVRESFRLHQEELAGLDIVVMNRPDAATATNSMLGESLERHWRRCLPMKNKQSTQDR